MEPRPGTYALVLAAWTDTQLQVGKLGLLHVASGLYVYVGSAFGPGGVRARVAHHQRRAVRPHWHIDYLRTVTQLLAVCYTYDAQRREHQWAEAMLQMRGASIPLARFGASDCACATHLVFFRGCPSWLTWQRTLRRLGRPHMSFSWPQRAPQAGRPSNQQQPSATDGLGKAPKHADGYMDD